VYLGLVGLGLAALGLRSRKAGLWLSLALVSGVLALGPLLHVTRDLVEVAVSDRTGFVVLPGALLTRLPFYEWARGPARFAELTVFSVAVMASYGVVELRRHSWRWATGGLIPCVLLGLLLLDYSVFLPFPTQALQVPEFYRSLQSDQDQYGVLDVGTERFNHDGMYFQTVHQHPLARGFIYRYPSGSEYYQEFLEQLVNVSGDIIDVAGLVPRLRQLDLGLVILHRLSEAEVDELAPFLAGKLGQSLYEDGQIIVYQVPSGDTKPAATSPLLMLGEQWHPVEVVDGVPSRWMVNDGVIYARAEVGGRCRLALTIYPFSGPRHLQVFVADRLLETYDVGGILAYETSAFELAAGEWTPIRFHVPEGCEVPEGQEDQRCLSMLFQSLEVTCVESES
jgi:hypothetical protein